MVETTNRLLPADWRRDPVAAGIALAAATTTLAVRETAALEPGTAERKLYYETQPPAMFTYNMIGPGGPLIHGPGAWAMYGGYNGAPIASNSAVFACLAVIVKGHWQAPLRVYREDADGNDEWLRDHPFQALVDDPHQALTVREVEWWRLVALHVHGNAYLRKVRAGAGNPVEVQLLSPTRVLPITTKEDAARGVFISHYRWEYAPSEYEDIPFEDVIHFRFGVDESDQRLGCSPLQRVIREVCTDEEAMAFTEALLKNTGAAGLVIIPSKDGPPMTKEQALELKERVDASFTAGNRGKTSVLAGGADIKQMGFSPQAMDLKAIHRVPEERIAAVLGVHPMVAGLGAGLERSTFSNFEEARDALFEQTIVPLYIMEEAVWQKHLLRKDFDTDPRVTVHYDLTNVAALQEDQNALHDRVRGDWLAGMITLAHAQEQIGMDPDPNGDVYFLPNTGTITEPDNLVPPEVDPATGLAPGQTPPALPAGADDEAGDGGEDAPPEERARRVAEQKAMALRAFPGLLDAVHDLAAPVLEQDMAGYLSGQRARVTGRLKRGG